MAELAGGKTVIVEASIDNGFLMTAEQLRGALTPASRVLILCTPSNPTGAVYDLQRLKVRGANEVMNHRLSVGIEAEAQIACECDKLAGL